MAYTAHTGQCISTYPYIVQCVLVQCTMPTQHERSIVTTIESKWGRRGVPCPTEVPLSSGAPHSAVRGCVHRRKGATGYQFQSTHKEVHTVQRKLITIETQSQGSKVLEFGRACDWRHYSTESSECIHRLWFHFCSAGYFCTFPLSSCAQGRKSHSM